MSDGNGHAPEVDINAEMRASTCAHRIASGDRTGWCQLPAGHGADVEHQGLTSRVTANTHSKGRTK